MKVSEMDAVGSVVGKLKGLAKSTQEFVNGVLLWCDTSNRRNPIEILKRLQREAFSDLMKLRDRQEKVERLLTFYKTSNGNLFDESGTRVRGEVDVLGALLMTDSIDEQNQVIQRSGIRTGVSTRFSFETTIRQNDALIVEFLAGDKGPINGLAGPLSLSKVFYSANINDWFSVVGMPVGGRCRDVASDRSYKENGLTDYSFSRPPLLNQHCGSGVGLAVKKSNVVAFVAQFISGLPLQPDSATITHCVSTFGQIFYQLSKSTRVKILGLHRAPKSLNQHSCLGNMAVPIGIFRRRVPQNTEENVLSSSSMALMIESDVDESTRIGGWLETRQSNPRHLQWAVSVSDAPEDDFGWGVSLGGLAQGPESWEHFQAEAFVKLNFGKRFSLQPAVIYAMDRTSRCPALLFRSSWSL